MSGAFISELWVDHIMDAFRYRALLDDELRIQLKLGDRFIDQLYDEAVAWAALLGIIVLKPLGGMELDKSFRLMKPGHAPVGVPMCPPKELIVTLRALADGSLDLAEFSPEIIDSIRINRPVSGQRK